MQGGSFGRGTALKSSCDAELVIFLNCFKDYRDQGTLRAEILDDMRMQLESWVQNPVPGLNLEFPEQNKPGTLQFQLTSVALESWVNMNLLPVFDAVAYALELLTIFAWEQGCKKESFHMAQGFRTVLGLVQQHRQLCVYWTVNYGLEDPALRTHVLGQLQKPRPLVLDPADPTWNVGEGNWELLAQEAAALETQACFVNGDGTPVLPWDVMPTLLYQTPAGDLNKFISEFLQPTRQFLDQVNKAVNTICSFLRENCFRNSPIKVLKVVKGGSSAKGTALRGRSDADLVVFLSCFGQFTEQGNRRAEVISEIRAQLEACQREKQFEVKFEISKWENPRVLSFSLMSQTTKDQSIDFDVLPAFDALGQLGSGGRPSPQVYVDLIHSYSNAGEYSTCFTELQRDFIISRPTKLKSLIRLVKHWYQQCNRMPKGKGSLPPQHGLELLTVYAWEQGGQDPQFNMAEGFRTVLELVSQYHKLCIYWTTNYKTENKTIGDFLELQLKKPRPIILDPADPTGNLGHNARWDLLAKEAAAYMSALCCMGKDGTPIQPWPVKPRIWGASGLVSAPAALGARSVSSPSSAPAPPPNAAATASHPRDPGVRLPASVSVGLRGCRSALGGRGACEDRGAEAGPRLPPARGEPGRRRGGGASRLGSRAEERGGKNVGREGTPPPAPAGPARFGESCAGKGSRHPPKREAASAPTRGVSPTLSRPPQSPWAEPAAPRIPAPCTPGLGASQGKGSARSWVGGAAGRHLRRSRARVGWGVPTGPRPPGLPTRLRSCSPGRWALGALRLPRVRSAATQAGFPGRCGERTRVQGRPLLPEPSGGGPRLCEQLRWSQAQGLGRGWERRELAGRHGGGGELQAGSRASWVTGPERLEE
ncbi:PREDICTED: 2'-5'-oligoadenylate synthase 3-like [Chrysochloris asiatica]|uniref:2'-5' oligoadenylate synthase n=1 Tax=Chrysochloris asiatica TaxID=185453 RepID=A0A9B0WVS4_CHRAS|nr:PREDICTED: 2'-5'-oligoadenylate synthase 3-like [Chrysochloris asiatica]